MSVDSYDVVVVGGGSGGLGAAISASRLGCKVLLLEKANELGGTAVHAGVNCWEPGVGGTGVPFEIYRRLVSVHQAVGIYSFGRHGCWSAPQGQPRYPGGEALQDPARSYADTLRRFGAGAFRHSEAFIRKHWHGVVFEPDAYIKVVNEMLAEARCAVLVNTAFRHAEIRNDRVVCLELNDGRVVHGKLFIDSTGDACLAKACGCRVILGQDSFADYAERDAPATRSCQLNGVSLLFRVRVRNVRRVDSLPDDVPATCWWSDHFPNMSVFQYPNSDLSLNMLPTMKGNEAIELGPDRAYHECLRRTRAQWHHCQMTFPEFQQYHIVWTAPTLGVRESHRIVGRYVLTEHDLLAGLSDQVHDDIIAIADHAMDTHGGPDSRCGELSQPYGIPYRCLLPEGITNLIVACRGASFSSIAASSCRLSRTMFCLGQAAGSAAALALQQNVDPSEVDIVQLRDLLGRQHIQLHWPIEEDIRSHIGTT
ncbi:MAG: FAD-dependent oxidoreductase [Planctomycetes bacterium]|nr:FAD-dependent oxidoreductase [Planctomycetota bacterium]